MAEARLPSSDMAALDQQFWQQMERERATFAASHPGGLDSPGAPARHEADATTGKAPAPPA